MLELKLFTNLKKLFNYNNYFVRSVNSFLGSSPKNLKIKFSIINFAKKCFTFVLESFLKK